MTDHVAKAGLALNPWPWDITVVLGLFPEYKSHIFSYFFVSSISTSHSFFTLFSGTEW